METINGGVWWKWFNVVLGRGIQLPLSVDIVISNDDLLIEILLRLPVFSLHVFKSVSKRWLSLIIDPTFTIRKSTFSYHYTTPSGIFLRRRLLPFFEYAFVPFDNRISTNQYPFKDCFSISFDARDIVIMQSCNGLLLCCSWPPEKVYVYNPFINRFKIIPRHHNWKSKNLLGNIKINFDPIKSRHYKVVVAGLMDDDIAPFVQIHTYYSETEKWIVYGDRFSVDGFKGFYTGIYWNDAFHWLDGEYGGLHYKLDVDRPLLTTIRPPKTLDGTVYSNHKLFESCGCLLFVCMVFIGYQQLNVYEMRKGYTDWSVKYLVNLDDVIMRIPETWKKSATWVSFKFWCIVVGKRDEDSFLVMELFEKVVQYKIVLKTSHKLFDLGSIRRSVRDPSAFSSINQFIASFASV